MLISKVMDFTNQHSILARVFGSLAVVPVHYTLLTLYVESNGGAMMSYLRKKSNSINKVTVKLRRKKKEPPKDGKKHTTYAGTKILKMLEMIECNNRKGQQKN